MMYHVQRNTLHSFDSHTAGRSSRVQVSVEPVGGQGLEMQTMHAIELPAACKK